MVINRQAVLAALRDSDGNIREAARSLDISRRTLQNRLREYGMARSKGGRPKKRLKYGRRRNYLAAGAAAAGVLGYLLLRKGGQT